MQREKDMVKTFNFVYTVILFIFLFLTAKKVYGNIFFLSLKQFHSLL